jgi:type IV pilus assembly protein PilX
MTSKSILFKSQCGVVLVVSLIMLLLLTLIGLSAMQSTGLEEKMAGNMRDRNIAFQAAEAALRDAESDISSTAATPRISGLSNFSADCGAGTTSDTTDNGLCYNGAAGFPGATGSTLTWPTENMMTAAPSVAYGSFTGVTQLSSNLTAQPRYIIEGLQGTPGTDCDRSGGAFCYRITVRAQGINVNTVVWLQTVYRP